ncbi:hypothetical protein EKL43_26065 [Salmonella enterica subsp. enterica serovar Typhimurium]|nr:hypothetical protein EKL43_26065 [Salmonella enterica subsp. enterica serovar Typhimurium]
MRVICHRFKGGSSHLIWKVEGYLSQKGRLFEGGSSHLIWKVEGDLSQFCCSLPGILRLLMVFWL